MGTNGMNYHNSTFKIREDAKPLRSKTAMKRSRIKRSLRPTLKKRRESPAETKFKRAVRIRDDYRCQFPSCDVQSKRIDVHHIAKRSQRPDLKFEVSNGICLCRKHHSWTDHNHDKAVSMGLLSTDSYELAKKQGREAA
jgi:predicted restriction endonuclease